MAASMPPTVPQSVRTPRQTVCWLFTETMHTDPLDWSLPAHRRGTLRGMDAA
ncbi:hypothetical protein FHY18_000447 [Xanthomonas arboricola]|nr:hypothetical protein [Xanthomonas sp. 3793]